MSSGIMSDSVRILIGSVIIQTNGRETAMFSHCHNGVSRTFPLVLSNPAGLSNFAVCFPGQEEILV